MTLATEQSKDVVPYADLRDAEDVKPVDEFDSCEDMFSVEFWADPIASRRTRDQPDVEQTRVREKCLDLGWSHFDMESPRYEIIAGFSVEPDHRTKIILAEFFPQFDWEDTIEDSAPIRLLEPQAHWQRLLNLANFDGDVAVDWAAPRPENGDAGEDWPTCWNS